MDELKNISRYFSFGLGRLGGSQDIDSAMNNVVKPLLNYIVGFSVVVAVALIIASAYTLITSGGDPERISKGQKGIVAALIGMVIVFIARILVIFLLEKLGVS